MKKITLSKILDSLQTLTPALEVDPDVAVRARAAVERMLDVKK